MLILLGFRVKVTVMVMAKVKVGVRRLAEMVNYGTRECIMSVQWLGSS